MLLLILSCLALINSEKLFLIGGNLATTGEIYTALGRAANKPLNPDLCNEDWTKTTCPKVAVVTSASPSEADGNDAYSKDEPGDPSYYTMFKQNGFTSKHISAHIDNYKKAVDLSTAEGVHNLNILNQADVIFFNGGDQARHARTWLLDNGTSSPMFARVLTRYHNNEVVFAGTSAGTMIMSNPTFGDGISFGHLYFNAKVGLAQKNVKDGSVNGSGLADTRNGTKGLQYQDNGGKMPGFTVYSQDYLFDSHFDARGRLARFIPALRDTNKSFGIGVDENTAVYLNNGAGYVYGQNGAWIVSNKDATYDTNTYFQVQNIHLWVLTSGDSINLSTFAVSSSKELITTPKYNSSVNSTHVIDGYEMTKLVTRLVDQTEDENRGVSKTPSGYPKETPLFEFRFVKVEGSRGYFGHGNYTVERISVSVKALQSQLDEQQQ